MTTNLHDKMLAAIDAYFSASDAVEEELAENLLLDVRDELLKQPAQQQPVAWMHTNAIGHVYFRKNPQDKTLNPVPLYTSPPASKPWVGLTKDEVWDLWNAHTEPPFPEFFVDFKRSYEVIEAKLKEKNT